MAGVRPFVKMPGLGNDFVIVDARREPFPLDDTRARAITDRRQGVGCDQLIVIEPPREADADAFMRIRNFDGGESRPAATRRAASPHHRRGDREIRCGWRPWAARSAASWKAPDRVTVDMGAVGTDWRQIPLAEDQDTLHLDLALEHLPIPWPSRSAIPT